MVELDAAEIAKRLEFIASELAPEPHALACAKGLRSAIAALKSGNPIEGFVRLRDYALAFSMKKVARNG